MNLVYVILAFVFVIGLCIGSFLNVVILRSLSEESIVFPASKCPKCQKPLKWWHNIPVLSYIFLGGKCGFCKCNISIQYPLIELFTGIIFTLIIMKYGLSLDTLFAWIVAAILIVLAGTDIKEKVVFDAHTYSLVGVGLGYSALILGVSLYQNISGGTFEFNKELLLSNPVTLSIFGIILGVVIMELFARIGYLVAGTRAFGEGDTYIAAGLGAVFGWLPLLVILAGSVFVQVIFTMPVFVKKLVQTKDIKTLIGLFSFTVYAVLFFILQHKGILADMTVYLIATLILAALGLYLSWQIIAGIKKNKDDLTYLPYGPAMVVSAFIYMLFL